jgi:hypothetical protein
MDHLADGLVALTFLVVVPLMVRRWSTLRALVGDGLSRLDSSTAEREPPATELDQLTENLSQVLRVEQLRFHVRRLQRILATDMSMSATRQLANRLAYAWLLRELDRAVEVSEAIPVGGTTSRWSLDSQLAVEAGSFLTTSACSQQRSQVETLELGWSR